DLLGHITQQADAVGQVQCVIPEAAPLATKSLLEIGYHGVIRVALGGVRPAAHPGAQGAPLLGADLLVDLAPALGLDRAHLALDGHSLDVEAPQFFTPLAPPVHTAAAVDGLHVHVTGLGGGPPVADEASVVVPAQAADPDARLGGSRGAHAAPPSRACSRGSAATRRSSSCVRCTA